MRLSYTENPDIDVPETVFYDNATNTQGWDSNGPSSGGTAEVATDKSYSGGKSFKIHRTTGTSYYAHSNERVTIDNDEETAYTFSGRIFVESAGYAWGRIILFMDDETGTEISTEIAHGDKIKTKGEWVYYEKTVMVPANIDKINLRIGLYHQTDNATAWFDDLKIVKGNLSRTTLVEESNYYPFGLKHKGYNNVVSSNGNSTAQKFGFGGKELSEELGIQWHDFSARNYDASLGRWMNIDPLAEQMRRHSPYNYAFNSPVYFIDPDGMAPVGSMEDPIYDKKANLIGDDGKSGGKIHIVYNKDQAKEIKAQTKNGNTAIDLSGKDVVTLHGGKTTVNGVIKAVNNQGKDTSPGAGDAKLHEEGGNVNVDSKGKVTSDTWTPGAKKTGTKNASIKPFIGAKNNPAQTDGIDMYHTHTSGSINSTDSTGAPIVASAAPGPSNGDKRHYKSMVKSGYTNVTAIQIDTRGVKKVNFYNGGGTVTSIKYKHFKKLK